MTSATALPPVRFPLGLRFAAIAAVAVITYVVEAMWRLGALLQAFAHSLMRRPPPTGDVLGLLGGLLYWVVIAAAAGLAIALFARSRYLRLVVSIWLCALLLLGILDRKSTRLNSSHDQISYAVFCSKKKKKINVLVHTFFGISSSC